MKDEYKYLKYLDETTLNKLFEVAELNEEEKWVLKYSFKGRMVQNICAKLLISESTYRNIKNTALAKIHLAFKLSLKH